MDYQFVRAAFDSYGTRDAPALALVVHTAEGGNTVNYLAGNPGRGVSVHFVCQYDGDVVQMLALNRVSGSINPKLLRRTDDAPFTGYNNETIRHGITARRAVLGQWAQNPNHAVITIEVEGFAKKGPNIEQRKALVRWARDMREKLPTLRGLLGHRDFASYKLCPGRFIPWANMGPGGHGLWTGDE